ncbi:MAG: CARDB domain-containing protein [Candidatus Omnitrophota bacterium]
MRKIFQIINIIIFVFLLQEISFCYAQGGITGKVSLQNRVVQSGIVTFELRMHGETTPLETYQITSGSDGIYSLSDIPSGIYDVTAKANSFLKYIKTNVVVYGENITASIDFYLLGGDCDGNDVINMFDHSIFNAAFGSVPGDANWNELADIDGNGVVNMFDHSVQNANFGKSFVEPEIDEPSVDLKDLKNYLVYYGSWDSSIVASVNRYSLLILNINRGPVLSEQVVIIDEIQAGVDGVSGTEDDVVVLAYISLGEDERTYGFKEPIVGDGSGPCFFDIKTGEIIYEDKGMASYYMDEWNVNGPHSGEPLEHDGIPDRHGTWGACYVNAGDPDWHSHIIGVGRKTMPYSCDVIINTVGYDGFFLDTPEIAGPYEGFGWTAKGMHDLIKVIDETYPDKILLLNRGVFFFVPHYKYQYQWCPRKYVDIVLYESYYLDSAYEDNFPESQGVPDVYHYSPYYDENRYFIGPKFNVELGRPDSFCQIVNIDYVADPDIFPTAYPDVYSEVINKSIVEQGRLEFLTNKLVTSLNTAVIDNLPPADMDAPIWLNTTNGLKSIDITRPYYNSPGADDTSHTLPRIGIQKVIPGNGKVTVRWDGAVDQTRPVKYNIYYSTTTPIDFDTAVCLPDVVSNVGGDYTNRGYLSTDDVCPFEYTVTNLSNEETYYCAVRAEDSSMNASGLATGRIGPRGGIEDTNEKELAAAPRAQVFPINIDGNFGDWLSVPYYADKQNDTGGGEIDWTGCKITDNENYLYVYFDTQANIALNDKYIIYLNVDQKSYTGFSQQKGADYMIKGGQLLKYIGDGEQDLWENMYFIEYSYNANQMEMGLVKSDIKATAIGIGVNIFFYADNSAGDKDYMPDDGACGFSYTYLMSPADNTPPDFDIYSFAVTDQNIDGTIKLEWTPANDVNLPVTYEIYDEGYNLIATTTETNFYLNHLVNNQEYTFIVRAVDNSPHRNYINSAQCVVIPTLNTTPPQWGATTGIQKVIANDASVKIYWDKATDESHPPVSFNIYYNTQPIVFGGTETKLPKIDQKQSDDPDYAWMYSLAGLTNEQTYYFMIRSEDRIGNEDSNITALSAMPTAPLKLDVSTMDGVFNDWTNDPTVVFCGKDNVGDGTDLNDSADITDLWLADNDEYLFVRWQLAGEVLTSDLQYMLFIDTDSNKDTGFLTSWDSVGAEFLLMNGTLMKYTGVNGKADWLWEPMEDNVYLNKGILKKNNIELALSRNSLGLTGEDRLVSIWFYISDEVNETLDECYPNYGNGGFVYQFSQVSDNFRIDGKFNDWDIDPSVVYVGTDGYNDGLRGNGDPDDISESADIKNIWIGDSEKYLYLHWQLYGQVDFSNYGYYVFLDVDNNTSTGYKASWGAVGAEYMVLNGIIYTYTGVSPEHTDWSWGPYAQIIMAGGEGDKFNDFEMAVSRDIIGELGLNQKTTFCFSILDDKGTTDFNDDVYDFYPAPGGLFTYSYSQTSYFMRIDGNFGDWEGEGSVELIGTDALDDGYNQSGEAVPGQLGAFADIESAWAAKDVDYLYLRMDFSGDIDFNLGEYTIYFDINRSSVSGYQMGSVGAEYRFYNGVLYHYIGNGTSWEWETVTGGASSYAIGNTDHSQMEIEVKRTSMGWSSEESIGIFIIATDTKETVDWNDNINDFMPEQGKVMIYPVIPLADLRIKTITYTPMCLWQGVEAVISMEVENIGSGDAGNFEVNIWIDGTAQTAKTINGLTAGSSGIVTFNWTPMEAKSLWIGGKADSANQINEEDETNNENGINVTVLELISGLLTIDGDFGDWEGEGSVELIGADALNDGYNQSGEAVPGQLGAFADIENAWAAKDAEYLYLRLDFSGDIDFNLGEYTIYFDIDRSNGTGYQASLGTVGAEYRFYNGVLYHYIGNGTNWEWEDAAEGSGYSIGNTDHSQMEIAVKRTSMGWSSEESIGIFMIASDKKEAGWEDDISDFMPEIGSYYHMYYPIIPLCDLTAQIISIQPPVEQEITVGAIIRNIDTQNSSMPCDIAFLVDGIKLEVKRIGSLSADSQVAINFSWHPAVSGSFWLVVTADDSYEVNETNETNNSNGYGVIVDVEDDL